MVTRSGIPSQTTCPHCWHKFHPWELRWVSMHPGLRDDAKVAEGNRRFLPTRFDPRCRAIDPQGESCTELACPNCHLVIPRDVVELAPTFFSIVGAPSSGKSYFLTAALWRLRSILDRSFGINFEDSDPEANDPVHEYVRTLFQNSNRHEIVALPKTELDGDLYRPIQIEPERTMILPRPFVFRMQPTADHPRATSIRQRGHTLCLYDNAGEHFQPGAETVNSPGTKHLSVAKALFFVFDPTQHHRVRQEFEGEDADVQLRGNQAADSQDQLLAEATRRVRDASGLLTNQRDSRPLIVVLTKYDAWSRLLGGSPLTPTGAISSVPGSLCRLNLDTLANVSELCGAMLADLAPEVVNAIRGFADDITYIPCSALGCSPIEVPGAEPAGDPPRTPLGVRPKDVDPIWAEIPFLYALHRTIPGLIGSWRPT